MKIIIIILGIIYYTTFAVSAQKDKCKSLSVIEVVDDSVTFKINVNKKLMLCSIEIINNSYFTIALDTSHFKPIHTMVNNT